MQYGKQTAGLALILALTGPVITHAADLKGLVTEAIINEKSTGYLDEPVGKLFTIYTKSKSPVQFMARRIEKYSDRCAKLDILINQPDAPMDSGEIGTFLLRFQLPICLDGTYPEILKAIDDERMKQEMAQCQQSVVKGVTKDGFMNGSINFKSCPKNGVVGIFYAGSCKELNPGKYSPVKEFDFDDNGVLSIKMAIPKSCLTEKSNPWQLVFFEKSTPKAAKVMIGKRVVNW